MATSSSPDRLKFITWNVNGLGGKIDKVKTYLDKEKADICFLQDIKMKTEETIGFENYRVYVSPPRRDHHRVAILIKNTLPFKVVKTSLNKMCCLLRGLYKGETMTLVNIYRTHEPNEVSFEKVFEALKDSENVIIGGDFNVVINPSLDRTTGKQRYVMASNMIRKYMNEYGLCDSWRMTHPDTTEYTHESKSSSSRIDYFLIHKSLMRNIETEILECDISDHNPVSLTLDTGNLSKYCEYYKLMSPQNDPFLPKFEEELESIVAINSTTNKLDLWEQLRKENRKMNIMKYLVFNFNENLSIRTSSLGPAPRDYREINQTFQSFHKELYSAEQSDGISWKHPPTLSPEDFRDLEEPFTEPEISNALELLKNSSYKSEAKYYKHLWPILSRTFMGLLKELKEMQTLPDYMKKTTIKVQLEPNKRHPSSYRPLHLMDIDVMIITTVLANRLEPVLPTLTTNLDQVENFSKWDLGSLVNKGAYVIPTEHCLEKVDRTKLFRTLELCEFGPNFMNWIKLIYSDPEACVCTNGIISEFFPLQRGLRLGCPLSPLLFDIYIQPLASAVTRAVHAFLPFTQSQQQSLTKLLICKPRELNN